MLLFMIMYGEPTEKDSRPRYSRRELIAAGLGMLGLYTVDRFNLVAGTPPPENSLQPLQPESGNVEKDLALEWLPDSVRRWQDHISNAGRRYSIDPNLIAIIITLESGGWSKATSPAGAEGLMQIMPKTQQDIASKHLLQSTTSFDIWDPGTNIEFGTAYLRYLINEFGEAEQGPSWDSTVELVAAGYNGGPGAAADLYYGRGLKASETVIYSRNAMNMWRERHAESSPTYHRWLGMGGETLIAHAQSEM